MKKAIFMLMIFFSTLGVFGQNIDYSFIYSTSCEKFPKMYFPTMVYRDDDFLFLASFKPDNITKGCVYLQASTSINCKVVNHFVKDIISNELYLLEGKGLVVIQTDLASNRAELSPSQFVRNIHAFNSSYKRKGLSLDPRADKYKNWLKWKSNEVYYEIDKTERYAEQFYISIYDAGIKNITASSVLSENTKLGYVEYSPDNLLTKLFYRWADIAYYIEYDNITPVWAEGKEDYGIGEYLDIEFKWEADELQILNGFVDFSRMDLYEKNSRVKTVLIESESPKFKKEYELEDVAKYNLIKLPQKTNKIRITIKDVYPGSKYKDTCLSSILVTNPNRPSYEEMSAKILNSMKEGAMDIEYKSRKLPLPDFIKIIER